jgi:hypothetical protein
MNSEEEIEQPFLVIEKAWIGWELAFAGLPFS